MINLQSQNGYDFNILVQSLSNILSVLIIKTKIFDSVYITILNSFLAQIFYLICTQTDFTPVIPIFQYVFQYFYWKTLFCCVLIFVFYKYCTKYMHSTERELKLLDKYYIIKLMTSEYINSYTNYVIAVSGKGYYDTQFHCNYGDIDKIIEADKLNHSTKDMNSQLYATKRNEILSGVEGMIPLDKTKIHFDDPLLGVKGYYCWTYQLDTFKNEDPNNKHEDHKKYRYIEIYIEKSNESQFNSLTFMTNVTMKRLEIIRSSVSIKYAKILGMSSDKLSLKVHNAPIYTGHREKIKVLEKQFINTLFHPMKNKLWNQIKTTALYPEKYREHGQIGYSNYLLYGPPGTGKSTFAYRIARTLNRNIVSLDIRSLTKEMLYSILQSPQRLALIPGDNVKDIVYVFEEIDIGIKEMAAREKCRKLSDDKYSQNLEHMMTHGTYTEDVYRKIEEKKRQHDVKNKDEKYPVEFSIDANDIKNLFKTDSVDTDFTVRDLLELIQGPVPMEGSIIIATTNDFDGINKICPELFRHGRMTPIYFGYLDINSLQELSNHYFGKPLTIKLPQELSISTSQIIELAQASILTKIPYETFSMELEKLLISYQSHIII